MLKKCFFVSALLFGVVTYAHLSANQGCEPQCPPDQPTGEGYCKYVRYDLQCDYTKRCVEEQIPCTRKCYRQVPEYYTVQKCKQRTESYCEPVQKCRYVPDYYTVPVQKCRYVPEYYTVDVQKCRYVPQYYTVNVEKTRCVPEYYTEQKCRYKTECYDVQEYKTQKRYFCEPNYKCVPRYYWKYQCNTQGN
ncbi:MAG: hypothetical protein WAM28_01320 [Chlamydiales bacterium]